MSPREAVQEELQDTLVCLGLDDSYGIIAAKDTDKKGKSYRSLTFAKARILDGVIHIYSPRFILIKWQTAIRRLPHKGQEVFKSSWEAKKWLQENFGNTMDSPSGSDIGSNVQWSTWGMP